MGKGGRGKKKVERMPFLLLDEEEVRRIHKVNVRREVVEETGRSYALECVERMISGGEDLAKVSLYSGLSMDEVERITERPRARDGC